MPLVRLQVLNEYGLGQPELYKEASREDPKAVLDGVAVAGLVGILRQLGDLADFAAEVFHGLQEQAMITATRSHKLMVRVKKIESSLPPLEKAVLAQTSHIHFAYTAGCEWHPRIKARRNHFIYNDLPQFIMDSYEECRDPPRLHLLDKFDAGGPGSCLMRYSDPTFFKRVSAYSDEAYSEKFERARKTRKSKKKRSSRRDGYLQGEQMHSISGRTHFISPTVNGRTTSSHTASTIDMTVKSDPDDRSSSFDSRAGADYIECVFHPTNSMQPDDQDYKESSSSRLNEKSNTLHSVSPLMDDNISIDSLEKQNASSSSAVTWQEKEEIVEPMSLACDKDSITEILAQKQDLDMHDDKAATLTNIDYNDILFDEESKPKPVASNIQTDDIDSEHDNYMDALNTIELESENDPECETKQELDKITSYTDGIMEYGVGQANSNVLDHNLSAVVSQTSSSVSLNKETGRDFPDSLQVNPPLISDLHVSNLESLTPSSVPVNREMTSDLPDCQAFEVPICKHVPRICENYVFACSGSSDLSGSAHTLKDTGSASIKNDISSLGSKSSGLPGEEAVRISNHICEFKEIPTESAGDHSVRLWTNGGLLGLEPSKPPDLTMSSSLSQASLTTKNEMDDGSNHNSMPKSNGYKGEKDLLAEFAKQIAKKPSSRCLTSSCDDQASFTERTSDSHQLSHESSPTDGNNLDEIRVIAPRCVLPVAPDTKETCTEPNRGSGENSSRVFGLGQMLLINSFRQKVSFDEKSVSDSSLKPGILEQSGRNGIADQSLPETTFKEKVGYAYPIDFLPPSPPLEHMKISFHPIIGHETSKLKLQFPDGTNHHESTRDMFPSFQLVPEPSIPLHDSRFNSDDDDTFCRSSPYVSDDCPSPHSDYNSDQWESGDTLESSDHGVHDSSHRRSSTESPLSSEEVRGVSNTDINMARTAYTQNAGEPSLSGPFLDFPSFDSVSPVLKQDGSQDSNCNNKVKSEIQADSTPPLPPPPPPPLPSMQRWASKPRLDMINGTQNYIFEDVEQTKDLNPSESTFSWQPGPVQVEQKLTNRESHKSHENTSHNLTTFPKVNQQKFTGQKDANNVRMIKEMAEKEDFLYQIRTKSFNLRRTVTGKPNSTSPTTTNVKVTAILEKANAIRQVVASDDGEDDDDNWSDP